MTFLKNGLLIVNKPINWTSNDVLRKLKSLDKFKRIGHGGTLDPLATGILPILINKATKYFDYFLKLNKTYLAEITFGYSTNTYDLEGDIVEETKLLPENLEEIRKKTNLFKGLIEQQPPIYSALKKNGKKLYEYARNNETVEIESREVFVENIQIIKWENPKLVVEINCSSGFYVRSFANDLAKSLNSLGVLSKLSRIKYGPFKIEDFDFDINEVEKFDNFLIPIDSILKNNQSCYFDKDLELKFYEGQVFTDKNISSDILKDSELKIYNSKREFIGLLIYDSKKKFWKPKNILN
jgi:tRNA pseudouridine55 synthase